MKLLTPTLILLLIAINLQATNNMLEVNGLVVNTRNEPVIGAQVSVKGTDVNTTTDTLGRFKMTMPEDHMYISIRSFGLQPKEVKLSSEEVHIVLEPYVLIEDIVIVAPRLINPGCELWVCSSRISADSITNKSNIKSTDKHKEININIYPNPTSKYVNIESKDTIDRILLRSSSGKTVHLIRNPSIGVNTLRLDNITDGMYFLSIINKDKVVITQPVVVINNN
jgi:hypothetical protein